MKLNEISASNHKQKTVFFILSLLYILLLFVFSKKLDISQNYIFALILTPIIIFLILLNFEWNLLLFFALLHFIYFFFGNFVLSHYSLFIPFFFIILILKKGNLTINRTYLTVPSLFLLFSFILSFIFCQNKVASLNWHLIISQLIIIYFFLISQITTRKKLYVFMGWLFAGYLISLTSGIMQIIISSGTDRVKGSLMNPNEFSGYLAFFIFISLFILKISTRRSIIYGAFGLIIISLYLLLETYSRGGQLAFFIAFLIYIYIKIPPKYKFYAPIIIFFFTSVILLFLFRYGDLYVSRFTSFSDGNIDYSTLDRVGLWISSWKLFLSSPIYGIGVNNFQDLYTQFHPTFYMFNFSHHLVAHNIFLNTLAELGIIGFLALIFLHIAIFIKLIKLYNSVGSNFSREIVISMIAFFFFIVGHNMLDSYWTSYGHVVSHFMIVLFIAFIYFAEKFDKKME
ncbi:MAG: O-antigen ligase family protein [Candidatus Tenebribacter burtonii]|jgi:O-antigen ligase|nr:O-antigen ligase family protein [Candidatus Tenebribacter burtonii]